MAEYGEQLKAQARSLEQDTDCVSLMTMHSSKGLEFRVVYILDANEGITPHKKAVLDVDLEEERRMFYVAMTRARHKLCLLAHKGRTGKDGPSRFLNSLS